MEIIKKKTEDGWQYEAIHEGVSVGFWSNHTVRFGKDGRHYLNTPGNYKSKKEWIKWCEEYGTKI